MVVSWHESSTLKSRLITQSVRYAFTPTLLAGKPRKGTVRSRRASPRARNTGWPLPYSSQGGRGLVCPGRGNHGTNRRPADPGTRRNVDLQAQGAFAYLLEPGLGSGPHLGDYLTSGL